MLDETVSPTSNEAPQDLDITDQATLEQMLTGETEDTQDEATPAPSPEPKIEEPKVDEYRDRYSALRKDYETLVRQLKEEKAAKEANESKDKLKDMDYDQRMEYLMQELQTLKQEQRLVQEGIEGQVKSFAEEQDQAQIDSFLTSDPELRELPELHDIFKNYATSDKLVDPVKYPGVTWKSTRLEDIKAIVFNPMISKLAGKKITVRERPVRSTRVQTESSEFNHDAIMNMSNADFEKNFSKIIGANIN